MRFHERTDLRNCVSIKFSTFRRSAKFIVMLPCNSDDEVEDSWIHTSHHQLKHESTSLCIGKLLKFLFHRNQYSSSSLPDRKNLDKNYVHAAVCDPNSQTQKWEFQKKD